MEKKAPRLDLDSADRLLATIPRGRWTSYGDVAVAAGRSSSAGQPVASWLGSKGHLAPTCTEFSTTAARSARRGSLPGRDCPLLAKRSSSCSRPKACGSRMVERTSVSAGGQRTPDADLAPADAPSGVARCTSPHAPKAQRSLKSSPATTAPPAARDDDRALFPIATTHRARPAAGCSGSPANRHPQSRRPQTRNGSRAGRGAYSRRTRARACESPRREDVTAPRPQPTPKTKALDPVAWEAELPGA